VVHPKGLSLYSKRLTVKAFTLLFRFQLFPASIGFSLRPLIPTCCEKSLTTLFSRLFCLNKYRVFVWHGDSEKLLFLNRSYSPLLKEISFLTDFSEVCVQIYFLSTVSLCYSLDTVLLKDKFQLRMIHRLSLCSIFAFISKKLKFSRKLNFFKKVQVFI